MKIRFWIIFLVLVNMFFWLWLTLTSDNNQREPERLEKEFNASKIKILPSNNLLPSNLAVPDSALTGIEKVPQPTPIVAAENTPPIAPTNGANDGAVNVATNGANNGITNNAPAPPSNVAPPASKPQQPSKNLDEKPATSKAVASQSAASKPSSTAAQCLQVNSITASELSNWQATLRQLNLGTKVKRSESVLNPRYQVVLGPYSERKIAEQTAKKLAPKLKLIKITDSQPWWLIIGSFNEQESARIGQARVKQLNLKASIRTVGQKVYGYNIPVTNNTQQKKIEALAQQQKKALQPC